MAGVMEQIPDVRYKAANYQSRKIEPFKVTPERQDGDRVSQRKGHQLGNLPTGPAYFNGQTPGFCDTPQN
jgi:hypothetical protein